MGWLHILGFTSVTQIMSGSPDVTLHLNSFILLRIESTFVTQHKKQILWVQCYLAYIFFEVSLSILGLLYRLFNVFFQIYNLSPPDPPSRCYVPRGPTSGIVYFLCRVPVLVFGLLSSLMSLFMKIFFAISSWVSFNFIAAFSILLLQSCDWTVILIGLGLVCFSAKGPSRFAVLTLVFNPKLSLHSASNFSVYSTFLSPLSSFSLSGSPNTIRFTFLLSLSCISLMFAVAPIESSSISSILSSLESTLVSIVLDRTICFYSFNVFL